ncbi:Uncharacterized protein OS=Chloroflexus aurantiacus (strain ATCC 29364 / DSM 637 / Y-400-fl) GN=Chy400_4122 PE=4 SV=1: DUF4058: DUF4058 [Gemmataceae bacterium]|nr:Uncharacterized protein OS=Chloroflexus aurantiacus (strain ATCC 29364 / DSM 637 / Y-400-fl) GN=Chy400_4122 PE=4 SV=1: DUF4058: DUF4058 [Gemmataceae bacterium]VTU00515.1 Uncharacterized protein OS=Chloroflexus aurantiacus (strain ATCC 29364 / DSM 637 / Y-400-fl) GN=Chy400_4122 PE=4 SV=1: DUF4058: DUF4058 [Gemmataceae bacterium]
MPSPFPGMDPYLEHPKLWPAFQHQLLACLYQVLLPGLVDRYRARVGSRTYVSEMPLFTSVLREEYTEEFIEIRTRTDSRLVTLLEVVSPANKTTPAGRAVYLEKRKEAVAQRAAVVEVDLVMQGKPTLTYSRDGLPEFDHAVSVTRSGAADRYEIYTATIQKRLPKFKLPLAADDRDALLDLQAAFARAYDLGGFAAAVEYRSAPPAEVPLTAAQRAWVDELLKQTKMR